MSIANTRTRGIVLARADASFGEIKAAVDKINTTFEAWKAENDSRLEALAKGRDDIVTTDKLEKINADITSSVKAIDEMKESIAALNLAGSGDRKQTPAAREHAQAFNAWFRNGREPEAGLGSLEVKAALTSQSDPDGGFVVPYEMDGTIVRVLSNLCAMRGLARVVNTSNGAYKTMVSQGGAAAGWVGEEAARTATATPQLSEITVPAGELYANAYASQRLLDDASIDIAQWLADEVSVTFAEKEGAAFISGDGVNKPQGFLSYTPVANASYAWGKLGFVATGSSGAFATAGADNLIALHYALRPGYRNGGTFIMSDATMGTVRGFKDTTNQYIWAPPTVDGPETILGKPVATDENMPAVAANSFSIAFGNFQRGYLINDRMGTRVLRDPYTNKPYVNFYTTKRTGGGVVNFEAIKLLKFA